MLNLNRSNFQAHPFHLVSPSPWPLYTSVSLLSLTTSAVLSFHGFAYAEYNLILSLTSLILSMSFWFRDIIAEGKLNLINTILFNYNLNITTTILVEDLEKSLNDYKVINNIKVFKNNKNLDYYLAGLLESDGNIFLPSLKVTALNRVVNTRIVFTLYIINLSIISPQKVLSIFLLKLKFHVFFRLYGHVSKYNPGTSKDITFSCLKEISRYNIIPSYQNSIFVNIFLSGGWFVRSRLNNFLGCVKFC